MNGHDDPERFDSDDHELLTDLLRRAIVDQPMTPASLMATLEEGDWRPLCPACKGIDCLGCDDGMYERAEAALLVDYQAWVHFDDLAQPESTAYDAVRAATGDAASAADAVYEQARRKVLP